MCISAFEITYVCVICEEMMVYTAFERGGGAYLSFRCLVCCFNCIFIWTYMLSIKVYLSMALFLLLFCGNKFRSNKIEENTGKKLYKEFIVLKTMEQQVLIKLRAG